MSRPGAPARGRGPAPAAGAYEPRPVRVRAEGGVPAQVAGRRVEAIRERWLVEDRWWSERPVRRAYFDVVLEDGANRVVFCDLLSGAWHGQRD